MTNNDVVMIGLPCIGLQRLASAFDFPRREDAGIVRAYDSLHQLDDLAPEWMAGMLAERLHEAGPQNRLIVYQSPWEFLERRIVTAAALPQREEELEFFARNTLGFWHSYHAPLFGLYRREREQCLLINGDRPFEIGAVATLIEDQFGFQPGGKNSPAATGMPDYSSSSEHAFLRMVDKLAPECLELYAGMESCAALLGRQPEFEFDGLGEPSASVLSMLPLATCQSRVHHLLAQRRHDLGDIDLQLKSILQEHRGTPGETLELNEKLKALLGKVVSMQDDAALHLLQLQQLQEEMENRVSGRQ